MLSSYLSAYASMAGTLMLIRSMAQDLIPKPILDYAVSSTRSFFGSKSSRLTLIIHEGSYSTNNDIFRAAETFLATKITPDVKKLRVSKATKDKHVNVFLHYGETVTDLYRGVVMEWKFLVEEKGNIDTDFPRNFFELSFAGRHKDLVLNSYIPHVLRMAMQITEGNRILKMYTLDLGKWGCVNLDHPSTFDTIAMDTELKRAVMDDLDRFIRRRDFYKRVGKAWKRGYLLYGPPGTGKSSLVAAMANYLKFDVYDMQLATVEHDSDLRKKLLAIQNRSILVIEDIDCAADFPNRSQTNVNSKDGVHADKQGQVTLSGLLNFIDGLWSSCGDERIIIFTTNHKEKLDPALLRPGRMDMHIHMGYCTFQGFKTLASNYLCLPCEEDGHELYTEIKLLMNEAEVTPAQVAEELMKSEYADIALTGLVKVLKRKRSRGNVDESKNLETKRLKLDQ